jgi:hypothetical protein
MTVYVGEILVDFNVVNNTALKISTPALIDVT